MMPDDIAALFIIGTVSGLIVGLVVYAVMMMANWLASRRACFKARSYPGHGIWAVRSCCRSCGQLFKSDARSFCRVCANRSKTGKRLPTGIGVPRKEAGDACLKEL